jgi:NAD+ dependent glucose-6-phosphate dehydrogenase
LRIVVTGSSGNIGAKVADELRTSHDLVLIDRRSGGSADVLMADLSRRPLSRRSRKRGWPGAFRGADAVVHCAGDPRPETSRALALRHNVVSVWNILEVAALHGVSRIVHMSSNWVVRSRQEELGPARFRPDGPKIGTEEPLRPLQPYGVSKAAAEVLGRMFVDSGNIRTFIAVRIGHCAGDGEPHPSDIVMRSHWISDRDIRSLIRRCVEAKLEGFHVVYGVSAQPESPFDLTSTTRLLDWLPLDRATPLHPEAYK